MIREHWLCGKATFQDGMPSLRYGEHGDKPAFQESRLSERSLKTASQSVQCDGCGGKSTLQERYRALKAALSFSGP